MGRKSFKIILTMLLISIILFTSSCRVEKNKIIDLTGDLSGKSDMWKVSLNMFIAYNNELVIKLITEEFDPPPTITVDLLVKEKSVYNKRLEIVEDSFPDFGLYKDVFDSIKDLEKNYKDISIIINFNDKEMRTIKLDSIEIVEDDNKG